MKKVYCEHNALRPYLKSLRNNGVIELLHFSYDPNGKSRKLSQAVPSLAHWEDMSNDTWNKPPPFAWKDYVASPHLEQIKRILGDCERTRRDAMHIDSAYKSGCHCFVTCDKKDIMSKRTELEALLGVRFFHPDEDKEALRSFLTDK